LYLDGKSLCTRKASLGLVNGSADDRVKIWVRLKADISELPVETFTRTMGSDNVEYYAIDFEVEIYMWGAHTTFMIIYNGKTYNNVDREPVFEEITH
jgi:hypothetical protein